MMALNRFQARSQAQKGIKSAKIALELLNRPDKLISVILIGNNFVNIFAASIATLIAAKLLGPSGYAIAPLLLTFVILIFAEITPKTLAAYRPEMIAFPAARILKPLHWLFHPLVWIVNIISHQLLNLCGIKLKGDIEGQVSREELRTIVNESKALIPTRHRSMLLSILDLEHITIEDIMVPKNEVFGIDINDDFDDIMQQLSTCQHTRIPVFKGSLNSPIGLLHMRRMAKFLAHHPNEGDEKNKSQLLQYTIDNYFVAESTPLHTQLSNFQKAKRRIGLVIDEYGNVKGLVTLEDILEEIVGEFTTDLAAESQDIHPQEDGSYIIDGTANIRNINKALKWKLPTDGPKTLSGLIIEYLEAIPESPVSIKIGGYVIDVLQIKENTIKTAILKAMTTSSR